MTAETIAKYVFTFWCRMAAGIIACIAERKVGSMWRRTRKAMEINVFDSDTKNYDPRDKKV